MTAPLVSLSVDPGVTANAAVGGSATQAAGPLHAGYGASLTDVGAFEQALARAQGSPGATVTATGSPQQTSNAMQALMRPLDFINTEAKSLSTSAANASRPDGSLSPSEMVQLTVKCEEFMFHCQLTSNAANRTSDGLQQLFRQQS